MNKEESKIVWGCVLALAMPFVRVWFLWIVWNWLNENLLPLVHITYWETFIGYLAWVALVSPISNNISYTLDKKLS